MPSGNSPGNVCPILRCESRFPNGVSAPLTRQADTPFDVIFQDVHLDLVPAVRMREVEDQHVAPPHSPKPRHAVNLGLLQSQRRVEVEQPCAERRFPNRHEIPFDQLRLHRVAGDAEGGGATCCHLTRMRSEER